MGEIIRYIESDGTSHTLTSATVRYVHGEGLDDWTAKPVWDDMTNDVDVLSGWDFERKQLQLRFAICADSYEHARGTVAMWRQWFYRDVHRGMAGTVQVVFDGGTYTIPAAITTTKIAEPQFGFADVTLAFEALSFWVYGATQSTATAFAGTSVVSVTYDNSGDYFAYPVHVITGAVGTPTIYNPQTREMIQIGTAMAGAADVMYIWTNPVLIRYYAGGTAAGDPGAGSNWTGYAGTVSNFWRLGIGPGTVQIWAASGSATYELRYDIRKAGLG